MATKAELEKELKEAITAENIAFNEYKKAKEATQAVRLKIAHSKGFIIGRLIEYRGQKGQITHFKGENPVITFFLKNGDLGKRTSKLYDWELKNIKFTNE